MKDFFKYLTPDVQDRAWGLYLTVIGQARALPHRTYPSPEHPTGHFFIWEQGRVLDEYQLTYITEGEGRFECGDACYPVRAGTMLLLRPGMWHRYCPTPAVGWKEYYVGFNGPAAARIFASGSPADTVNQSPFFAPAQALLNVGIRAELLDSYLSIFDLIIADKPGCRQIAAGTLLKLLGYVFSFGVLDANSGSRIAAVIEQTRFVMHERVNEMVNIAQIARDYNIGYSYFRKMFKKHTGVAPHQYFLDIKLARARELLQSTEKSVKEISFELGFQSLYYFSRLFKEKTGAAPRDFRGKWSNKLSDN
ncbi:MAG: AraC family transcriptional regulator [Bacteroidales bacterium]|jgi:AraC-like DNA-binding protein|nr:AraC family transcriptional regulator [Bacteroidales bacterium]